MAKTPLSAFYNLFAVSNAVIHMSVGGGPSFIARPGSELDRATLPDTLLWRYMPKAYFFDILERRALFFTRLTYYHSVDPFEGALPYAMAEFLESIVRDKGGDVSEFRNAREVFVKQFLRVVLVNCWHERNYENRAMWDRYGGSADGIAVITTFEALRASLSDRVDVGHIEYVDIGRDEMMGHSSNPSHRAFQKLREFEDEREVRAVIFDYPQSGVGIGNEIPIQPGTDVGYHVPVDVARLVRRVVISPDTPNILDEVQAKVSAAGLTVDVVPSNLSRRPTY